MSEFNPLDAVRIETLGQLQEFLKARGFYGGEIDEIIGRGTRNGLLAWMRDLPRTPKKPAPKPPLDKTVGPTTNRALLVRVGGVPVYGFDGGVEFVAEMTINADGSPRCYHPEGSPPGLDYTANGGRPGNWWALATHNQKASGRPVIQGPNDPAPGFYVSMTALTNPGFRYDDPRRYQDSETVPFIVIPGGARWAKLGQRCLVANLRNGKTCEAVVADIGPRNHLGEGSIALAKALGVNPDAKRGGQGGDILYRIFS